MRGLDPRIHQKPRVDSIRWIAGSSPAMTNVLRQTNWKTLLALTLAAHAAVAVTSRAGLPPPRPCKRSEVEAGLCQPLRLVAAFAVALLAFDHALAATLSARGFTSIGHNHCPASSPRVSRGWRGLGSTGTACEARCVFTKSGALAEATAPLRAKVVVISARLGVVPAGDASTASARTGIASSSGGRRGSSKRHSASLGPPRLDPICLQGAFLNQSLGHAPTTL